MAIEISKLEVLVLKKLVLINYTLARQLSGTLAKEQEALTSVLNDIALRADADNHIEPQSLQRLSDGDS